ncbi:4Fe-4S binding protein [Methanohalophilus mahii]|uniref:Nitrite and sulphite reductase 4Fe-4S region n=1 Tax=Methanohalophilus mahii (strain ATCC 35705 / DSM 5219 / SLP) TaxID=547558 RepID=D5EA03_METMS|nr:4Fe-4S binding protein [Methanohalophilus mahii]ADE36004.1 nitrite and sulphite reductase 4Fe-4S region [Methanohalophilus mahii DSM 5219]
MKNNGFLPQKLDNKFSMCTHLVGGCVEANQLRALTDAAEKYVAGHVHITSRQGAEIPFVDMDDVENITEDMEDAGIFGGATGQKVRGVVACQGITVCNHGLINCPELAARIDEIYFGTYASKKFKIAITGCPASCMKPQENDFGIMGVVRPEWIENNCVACGLCEKICKADAISIDNGQLDIDSNSCIFCGECISSCKKSAINGAESGYAIFVGGKVGRFPRSCDKPIEFTDENRLFSILEKTLAYYRKYGQDGERFGDLLDRRGFAEYRDTVL